MRPYLFLLAFFVLCAFSFDMVNLIPNPSFESLLPTTDYSSCDELGSNYAYGCGDEISVDLAPWRIFSKLDVIIGLQTTYINCTNGVYCFDLNSAPAYRGAGVAGVISPVTSGSTYRFSIDLGGTTSQCGCASTDWRNVSITWLDASTNTSFSSSVGYLNLSNNTCRWQTYTVDVTMMASQVRLNVTSLIQVESCGVFIDNLRLSWLPCVDGSTPPAIGPGFTVTCGDGWSLTPPPGAAPLTVTAPIVVNGPMNVSQLDVQVDPSGSGPLITVTGVATINGTLTINIDGATITEGQTVSVINATGIIGNFSTVEVKRQGVSDCTSAEMVQDGGTLVGLFHLECSGPGGKAKGTGLTNWQIALIIVLVVITISIIAGVLLWLGLRARSNRRAALRQGTRKASYNDGTN